MSQVVFWIEQTPDGEQSRHQDCGDDLNLALRVAEDQRKRADVHHVSICAESPNQVGRAGVDTVTDGKLPDGSDYTWKKRRA